MSENAKGTFEVKLTPVATDAGEDGTPLARMTIDKRFEGDLVATSNGEMLSAGTPVKDSAGYVALERVQGALNGRRGSFVLQHHGIMDRGEGRLTITVVPDSGTGELLGLTGTMTIQILSSLHHYTFSFAFAEPLP